VNRIRKMILVRNSRRALWLEALLAVAVLQSSGCAVGPNYHTPVVQNTPTYKEVGN
jgi:hypothetical protein